MTGIFRLVTFHDFIHDSDILDKVGSVSAPQKAKVVSKEVSDELFQLMADVKLKADEYCIDTTNMAAVFKDSFVSDCDISRDDMKCMVENWVNIGMT